MTNKNEIQQVNIETGEISEVVTGDVIVNETEQFTVYQQPDGKFRKEMKYKQYYSHVPEDRQEMLELYKVLNSQDNDSVIPMARAVGKEFPIIHVYTNPYQSFDEETGRNVNGVTTTIFTGSEYYATSSKSVYYTLENLFTVFGYPDSENYEPINVKITSTRMTNGNQINLSVI